MSLRDPRYVIYFGAAAALGMVALRPSAERARGTLRAALLHPPNA
jgi:hypothetical protein